MLAHTVGSSTETECDVSVRIKGKGRNRTPSLTYSTSAKLNIDNGCTTPTPKPLFLFHIHAKNSFRCATEHYKYSEKKDFLVNCTLSIRVIEDTYSDWLLSYTCIICAVVKVPLNNNTHVFHLCLTGLLKDKDWKKRERKKCVQICL